MAKEKAYKGQPMLAASRFRNFYPTLPEGVKQAAAERIDELAAENPEYCDAGNYDHLCNIFSALALYEALQNSGKSKDEAFRRVSEAMWAFVENGTAKTYRKVFALPGMLKLLGRLLPTMFAKGSGYGWRYVWHTDTSTGRRLQFECTSCIYAQIFAKYGTPELGPMFCHCDDINYGSIPGLSFRRQHTLCKDGQPCDFLFVKE